MYKLSITINHSSN